MKVTSIIFVVLVAAVALADDLCLYDGHCEKDECCVTDFTGLKKECRDRGDEPGDPCGGEYFCGGCDKQLICVPLNDLVQRPANGSCQFGPPPPPPPKRN